MTATILTSPITLTAAARDAVRRGTERLLDAQHADGRWEGTMRSDPGVTAQFLLAARYMDRLDPAVQTPMLAHLDRTQLPGGGWAAYPGGPASLDVSLLCYAALRFAGRSPDSGPMLRAREVILASGGIEAVGFVARFPLVFCGQIPPFSLTYLSPKLLFMPRWFHPHLHDLGILLLDVLPLELLLKRRAAKAPPPGCDLGELRSGKAFAAVSMTTLGAGISHLGRIIDILVPARSLDRRAADWFADQQNPDGLWAGNAVFAMRGVMALEAIDGTRHRQRIDRGFAGMAGLQIADDGTRRQLLGRTPVLDTAIAVAALLDAGLPPEEPRLLRAARWLIDAQGPDGGWSFGLENALTPDADTTLHVLEALTRGSNSVPGLKSAVASGIRWLLSWQDRSGSWSMWPTNWRTARSMVREVELAQVMDVGTPEVTARVVRALARLQVHGGYGDAGRTRVTWRALDYLKRTQRPDGSWRARWAVAHAYAAAQGLTALAAAGDQTVAAVRARRFLCETQQADGGWGESPASDLAATFIPGPSTVTQTSFALLALLAAEPLPGAAAARAVAFLVERQRVSGWDDEAFCQTMLPGRMYFQNSLLPHSLALAALGRSLNDMSEMTQ